MTSTDNDCSRLLNELIDSYLINGISSRRFKDEDELLAIGKIIFGICTPQMGYIVNCEWLPTSHCGSSYIYYLPAFNYWKSVSRTHGCKFEDSWFENRWTKLLNGGFIVSQYDSKHQCDTVIDYRTCGIPNIAHYVSIDSPLEFELWRMSQVWYLEKIIRGKSDD